MTLDNHAALESLASLQLRPAGHRAYFHTDHLLVPIFRLEVTHRLRLLDPRIPHNTI